MGLDLFELTCRIEDELDVEIMADDFVSLARDGDILVGDLYEFVLAKLQLHDVGRYDVGTNYRLWIEVRSVLHAATEVPLDDVELGTPLETLFPKASRRIAWQAMRHACPYRVRELDYPPVVRHIGFWLAAAMVALEQFKLWQLPGAGFVWPLLGLLGLWMIAETYAKVLSLCAPMRTSFPGRMRTVKDLCRAIMAVNYEQICTESALVTDRRSLTVWKKLVEILADTLGVDADAVTFRSRLVRDLGMA